MGKSLSRLNALPYVVVLVCLHLALALYRAMALVRALASRGHRARPAVDTSSWTKLPAHVAVSFAPCEMTALLAFMRPSEAEMLSQRLDDVELLVRSCIELRIRELSVYEPTGEPSYVATHA